MMWSLSRLSEWLLELPLGAALRELPWPIPLLQTIHIVGIAAIVGSVLLIGLRLLNVAVRTQSIAELVSRLLPWVWTSMLVLFATGALMIVAEPQRALLSWVFQLKMALTLVAAVLLGTLQRLTRRDPGMWERSRSGRTLGRLAGVAALVLFTAIVFAGRLIAYVQSDVA